MSDSTSPVDKNQVPAETENQDQENSVKYDTDKKVLNEKKKRDEELREARSVIERYETKRCNRN